MLWVCSDAHYVCEIRVVQPMLKWYTSFEYIRGFLFWSTKILMRRRAGRHMGQRRVRICRCRVGMRAWHTPPQFLILLLSFPPLHHFAHPSSSCNAPPHSTPSWSPTAQYNLDSFPLFSLKCHQYSLAPFLPELIF